MIFLFYFVNEKKIIELLLLLLKEYSFGIN